MGATAGGSKVRKPIGSFTKMSVKKKGTRKWGAGIVAAGIAVAWAVGGLVLPSMAGERSLAEVSPTVVSKSDTPNANLQSTGNHTTGAQAALLVDLPTTKNWSEALRMFGTKRDVGEFTAMYLPYSCMANGEPPEYMPRDGIDYPDSRYFGGWALYEKGKAPETKGSQGSSATFSFNEGAAGGESGVLQSLTFAANEVETPQDGASVELGSSTEGQAEVSAPASSAPTESAASQPSSSSSPVPNVAVRDSFHWSWSDYVALGTVQYKRVYNFEIKRNETLQAAERRLDGLINTMRNDAKSKLRDQIKQFGFRVNGPQYKEAEKRLEEQIEQVRIKAHQDLKTAFENSFKIEFKPDFDLKVTYDPNTPQNVAEQNLEAQVSNLTASVNRQLNDFARNNGLSNAQKQYLQGELKKQIAEKYTQALQWLRDQYKAASGVFSGYASCKGDLVKNGGLVLVHVADRDGIKHKDVWLVTRKVPEYNTLHPVPSFLSDSGPLYKANGYATFCVEPFIYGTPSSGPVTPGYQGNQWDSTDKDLTEKIKALAWYYNTKYKDSGKEAFYKFQNAIWVLTGGVPEGRGIWNPTTNSWYTQSSDAEALITEALNAYRNSANVVTALEKMRLVEETLTEEPDGRLKITLQLHDYDQNPEVRSLIAQNIGLQVQGAYDQNGSPVNGFISLEQAEKGLTYYVGKSETASFSIGFHTNNPIKRVKDAYFIDGKGDLQGQIGVFDGSVSASGDLEVFWTPSVAPQKPSISTTATVDGQPNAAPEKLPYITSGSYTLSDDVQYQNLNPRSYYKLKSALIRVRNGADTPINSDDVLIHPSNTPGSGFKVDPSGNGVFSRVFSVTLEASDIKPEDKFYFTEKLYKGNSATTQDQLADEHVTRLDDTQSVHIGKEIPKKPKLSILKEAEYEGAAPEGTIYFKVDCGDVKAVFQAPAAGGNAVVAGGQESEIELQPGSTCQIREQNKQGADLTQNDTFGSVKLAGTTWSTGGILPGVDSNTFTVPENTSGTITVTATNKYTPIYGRLIVKKEVTGSYTNDTIPLEDAKFTFFLDCKGQPEQEFTLPDNGKWEKVFENLPPNQCSVRENEAKPIKEVYVPNTRYKVDDGKWINVTKTDKLGLTPGKDTIVTFENTYKPNKAGFVFRKVAQWDDGTTDGLPSGNAYTMHYSCVNPNNDSFTGTVKVAGDGDAVSLAPNSGIAQGAVCTVHETFIPTVDGTKPAVTLDVEGVEYTNTTDGKVKFTLPVIKAGKYPDITINAKNVYKQKTGQFSVTKKVTGDTDALTNFNFTVKCDDKTDPTSFTLTNGEKWTSVAHKVGTKCSVEETTQQLTSTAKYELTWSGAGVNKDKKREVTIKDGETLEVNANNHVTKLKGKIAVMKANLQGDAAASLANHDFTFELLNCSDGSASQEVKVKPGKKATFPTALPVGTICRVHEINPGIPGVTTKVNWDRDEVAPGYVQVKVPAQSAGEEQTLTVTATNTVDYQKASFTILKQISGFTNPQFGVGAFNFNYSCSAPDGKTYTQDKPFTVTGQHLTGAIKVAAGQESVPVIVPAGSKCRVTESAAMPEPVVPSTPGTDPVEYATTTMTVNGDTVEGLTSPEFSAKENTTVVVTATNTYKSQNGFDFIKSNVDGNNAEKHSDAMFTFNWVCQTPNKGVVYGSETLPVSVGGSVKNVASGTECVMWETNLPLIQGENLERVWTVNSKPTAGKTINDANGVARFDAVKFTTGEASVSVSLKNIYTVPTTSLTLEKEIAKNGQNVSIPADKKFTFKIDCEYSAQIDQTLKDTLNEPVVIRAGESKKFEGLPVGSKCSVTEQDANVAGHNHQVKLDVNGKNLNNGGTVTLDSDKDIKITATNTYTRQFGSFNIEKTLTGQGSIMTEPTYTFTYTCWDKKDSDKKSKVEGKFNLGSHENKTITGIPVGFHCEIAETAVGVSQDKWSNSLTVNGQEGSEFDITQEAVAGGHTPEIKVKANNHFKDGQGNFSLTKKVDPTSTASLPDSAKYHFSYLCYEAKDFGTPQATPVKSGEISLQKDETKTVTGIPAGAKCVITEKAPTVDGQTEPLTGMAMQVKWEYSSNDVQVSAAETGYSANRVFGQTGDVSSNDLFQIGRDTSLGKLVATNKFEKKTVELKLRKVAVAKQRGDYSQNEDAYTVENFNKSGATYNGRHYSLMSKNTVNMRVACGVDSDNLEEIGTYEVPVNGEVVTVEAKIPYGSKCKVTELDQNFNDWYTFWYGAWNHSVDMSVTDSSNNTITPSVSHSFDPQKQDDASIDFVMNTEATVTVNMKNKWDCFYGVTTDLSANGLNATVSPEGEKIVTMPNNPKARVTLSDTVNYTSLPKGKYVAVGRLFNLEKRGKVSNIHDGFLTWRTPEGRNWDYLWEQLENTSSASNSGKITFNYDVPAALFNENPQGIAAAVVIYKMPDNWVTSDPMRCNNNCKQAIAAEITLPVTQSIIPQWNGELKTQVVNTATKTNTLLTGKDATDQTVADTVAYQNLAKGKYDLYARVVQVGNEDTVIGHGTKAVTIGGTAQSNGLFNATLKNDSITINADALRKAVETAGENELKFVTYEFLLPAGSGANASAMTMAQLKDSAVASHTEAQDLAQQLFPAQIRTTATVGENSGTQAVTPQTTGTVQVVDVVQYSNLEAGKEYSLTGELHVKNTDGTKGDVLKDPGATKTITFKPEGKKGTMVSGSVSLTFEVQADSLKAQTVVAFEEVKDGGTTVAVHADITDKAQTVYSPSLKTTAGVAEGYGFGQSINMDGENTKTVNLTDKVEYNSIQPGVDYIVSGKLMQLTKDTNGKWKLASKTPLGYASATLNASDPATATHGYVDMTFNSVKINAGTSYVIFETLYKKSDVTVAANGKVTPKQGTEPVADHSDPNDTAQMIYAGKVTTDAKDGEGDKHVNPATDFTIKDEVTGHGLIPGKTYDVSGELMIDDGTPTGKATGIKQTGTMTANPDGTAKTTLVFTVTAQQAKDLGLLDTLQGKPIVVFEDLTLEGKPIAVHHDITDEKQTVHTGDMQTSATDSSDGNQVMVPGQDPAVIQDTVSFTGALEPNHKYTLVGELHYVTVHTQGNKTDSGKVPGVTVENLTFTTGEDGTTTDKVMEFKVPADAVKAGKDMVVFEYLYDGTYQGSNAPTGKNPVITHSDPNDTAQTITVVPVEINTTAYDGGADGTGQDTSDKNLDHSNEKVVIYDMVDYKGLQVGKTYTVTGELHYQADATLKDGTQVKAGDPVAEQYVTVTPATITANKVNSDESGAVKAIVKFEVDKAALATAPVVVFEDLKDGETIIATHHDINDDAQTVYNPGVGTQATIGNGEKTITVDLQKDKTPASVTITDTVTWTNLAAGNYVVTGSLMDKDTSKAVPGANAAPVTFTVTQGETSGTVTMNFTVPGKEVAKDGAKNWVVFEKVFETGKNAKPEGDPVATHEDINDANQTVTVTTGKITTDAKDTADSDNHADSNGKDAQIVDVVTYQGLDPNKNYTLEGELMEKDGSANGKPTGITSAIEVGPNTPYTINPSGKGTFELTFTVPADKLAGKTLVAFETLKHEGKDFLIHHDINDDAQTVYNPALKTQARVDNERGLVLADSDSVVKDTVTLQGLQIGKRYIVSGELMKKSDGSSTGITAVSKEFTAEKSSMTLKDLVSFEVPAGTVAEGDSLVVFEKLWLADEVKANHDKDSVTPNSNDENKPFKPAGTHEVITDPAQTVGTGVKPAIKTVLSDDAQRQWSDPAVEEVVSSAAHSLTDVVEYVGLTPGVKYRLSAELMEINPVNNTMTKAPVAEGYAEFTPQDSAGKAIVVYNDIKPGTLKPGWRYVAYETLLRLDKGDGNGGFEKVTEHKDKDDGNQTVTVEYKPAIGTTLSIDGKRSSTDTVPVIGRDDKDLVLKDLVKYQNLVVGKEYTLSGTLMKVDGANVVDSAASSEPVVFTPAKASGEVEMTFVLSAEKLKALMPQTNNAQIKLVAYEQIRSAGNTNTEPDAKHENPNDDSQTVFVTEQPSIGTTLKYGKSDIVWIADKAILTDTVEYVNLEPETQYTLTGVLMGGDGTTKDQQGSFVLNDTGVTGKTTFTTPKAESGALRVSGKQTVEFEVPRSVLETNNTLVAYEKLGINGNVVAQHTDPNDENQTVTVKKPQVGTDAKAGDGKTIMTWDGENSAGETAPDTYTITDTVTFENLEVGKHYALAAQIYEQNTYSEGKSKPIAQKAVNFTPEVTSGTTTVELTVKRADISNDSTLVVFEQLWAPGTFEEIAPEGSEKPVVAKDDAAGKKHTAAAEHNRIESTSQAVTVNKPEFGSLTLTKVVEGDWDDTSATVDRDKAEYKFNVTCGDVINENVVLKEDEFETIKGVALGTKCTIKEDTQNVLEQTGLKTEVSYTEKNNLQIESVENGVATVIVGGTADGNTTVANVSVTAKNHLVPKPAVATYTTGANGKVTTNGAVFTDHVKYFHMPAGNYLVHTYFVEYVEDTDGKVNLQKIDYVPSYATSVTVPETADKPVDGHNGTWELDVTIPKDLVEVNKKIVIWEDIYPEPSSSDRAEFVKKLQALPTGETAPGLVAKHHEDKPDMGEGTQWLDVTANFGSFQVEKEMVDKEVNEPLKQALPREFKFSYKATLPEDEGKPLPVKPGTKLEDEFNLTVDESDPGKAVSKKFDGFPVGTKILITESDVTSKLPTGTSMSTTWKVAGQTDGVKTSSKEITITAFAELKITAVNAFTPTTPGLSTTATTAEGGKVLSPLEDTPVLDTVTYSDLIEGRSYWLKTELVYLDDTLDNADDNPAVLGKDGQPLVRWTKVTANNSNWVVDEKNPMVVPADSDTSRAVVFYESLFEVPADGSQPGEGDQPVAQHRDPNDKAQIIDRRPELGMQTVAELDKADTITVGKPATIIDKVTYNGLKPDASYTLVGQLVKKSDGKPFGDPVTVTDLKSSADGTGTWNMEFTLTAEQTTALKDEKEIVVFERAYLGNHPDAAEKPNDVLTPVLSHEDIESAPQTVLVKIPNTPPPPTTPPSPPVSPSTTTPPVPPVSPSTTTPFTPPPSPPVSPAITIPPANPKLPPVLAKTGAQAATVGILALAMIAGGAAIGIYAGRRKRNQA